MSQPQRVPLVNKRFWLFFFGGMFFLAGAVALYVWFALRPLPAAPEAAQALQSDARVRVQQTSYGYDFIPLGTPKGGLAFYPGGRVEYTAYAPLMRQIAEFGYRVALMWVPFGLAVTAENKAQEPIAAHPELAWAVGGHSVGGVAASTFASGDSRVRALVLFAAYPRMDLSATTIPTLALFGSKDGVLPPEEARQRARLLPKGTEVRFLEGFNHSSYGAYGPQPGDQAATVEKLAGWRIVSREVVAFLEKHLQP